MKRVLPHPVGPLRRMGSWFCQAASKIAISLPSDAKKGSLDIISADSLDEFIKTLIHSELERRFLYRNFLTKTCVMLISL
jgi:hypothetical protein